MTYRYLRSKNQRIWENASRSPKDVDTLIKALQDDIAELERREKVYRKLFVHVERLAMIADFCPRPMRLHDPILSRKFTHNLITFQHCCYARAALDRVRRECLPSNLPRTRYPPIPLVATDDLMKAAVEQGKYKPSEWERFLKDQWHTHNRKDPR